MTSLPNYDNWLESPYQDAIAESDRYIQFCEDHDLDPDNKDAETLYQDYIDSQYEEPDYEDDIPDWWEKEF